jgi:hypothetical protein
MKTLQLIIVISLGLFIYSCKSNQINTTVTLKVRTDLINSSNVDKNVELVVINSNGDEWMSSGNLEDFEFDVDTEGKTSWKGEAVDSDSQDQVLIVLVDRKKTVLNKRIFTSPIIFDENNDGIVEATGRRSSKIQKFKHYILFKVKKFDGSEQYYRIDPKAKLKSL